MNNFHKALCFFKQIIVFIARFASYPSCKTWCTCGKCNKII